MADHFFPYRLDDRFKLLWWPLGVREGEHGVTLTEDRRFVATYGRFTLGSRSAKPTSPEFLRRLPGQRQP